MCSLSISVLVLSLCCETFQSLFPHGIDVLGKTDFYAVSVRRNAFLTAAPQVAKYVFIILPSSSAPDSHIKDILNTVHF